MKIKIQSRRHLVILCKAHYSMLCIISSSHAMQTDRLQNQMLSRRKVVSLFMAIWMLENIMLKQRN